MWKSACAVAAGLTLIWGASADAATITLGISTNFGGVRNFIRYLDTDTLVQSDPAEVFGMNGQLTDIAYDPSGVLYGLTGDRLFLIDEGTGVATELGRTLQFTEFMNALAFDAAGTLYAAGGNSSNLYTLDPLTGAATIAGTLPNGWTSAGDIAVDDDGVLWLTASTNVLGATNHLVRLDPGGIGTDVGDIGRGLIHGLVFEEDTLWGIGGFLYEIDRTDGSLISETGGYSFVQGAASMPSVPEPGAGWLLLGGLAAIGAHRSQRRRALA